MPFFHEKILKRPDGSRVKICIAFETQYHVNVFTCAPKKRKFQIVKVPHAPMMAYQKGEFEKRNMQVRLTVCTIAEIQEVALELWQANKPKFVV